MTVRHNVDTEGNAFLCNVVMKEINDRGFTCSCHKIREVNYSIQQANDEGIFADSSDILMQIQTVCYSKEVKENHSWIESDGEIHQITYAEFLELGKPRVIRFRRKETTDYEAVPALTHRILAFE